MIQPKKPKEIDFKDKKVLNLGPSTGYLSFEAERRGADVTSIDLSVNSEERDWVPQVQDDWRKDLQQNPILTCCQAF